MIAMLPLAACHRDASNAPSPRGPLPSPNLPPPHAPVAPLQPNPTLLQHIPGHSPGDAGIPPSPDPRSGPLLGWDLAPFDDGFDRDDATWLVLTERSPDGHRRDLINVGVRGGCHEIAPPMLHGVGDAGLLGAVRSVGCETPEPATFHLARGHDGHWLVARAGCVRPSRSCRRVDAADMVVGTTRVPSDGIRAQLTGALERRTEGPPLPAEAVQRSDRRVVLRLVATQPIDDGTGVAAHNLTLFVSGQRVDFGAVTRCRALSRAEQRAFGDPSSALLAMHCEVLDEGPRPIVVTRTGDVLSIRTRSSTNTATITTRRVGLPAGAVVSVQNE